MPAQKQPRAPASDPWPQHHKHTGSPLAPGEMPFTAPSRYIVSQWVNECESLDAAVPTSILLGRARHRRSHARAGAAFGSDADRKPARHHAAGAGNPRGRRRRGLRGHPRYPQAARPLRHQDPADAVPRSQRRTGPAHLIERIKGGESVALVSDAGTPLISDPGYKLVCAANAAGVPVTTAPGASSVLAALAIAGLPTDRFHFEGFLPAKSAARRSRVAELARLPETWCCSKAGRGSPRRSPILRKGLARAKRQYAGNSRSCTKKPAAGPCKLWRTTTCRRRNRAARS